MASSSPGGPPGHSLPPRNGLALRTSPSRPELRTRTSNSDMRSPSSLRRKSSHQSLQGGSSPSQTRSFYTYDIPPPPTAAQVAAAHWKKELALHEDPGASDTIVIVHDACYGHRFSRLRTAKNHLANIVERPERLQATAAGIAGAYVRLGERYTDGQFPIHPKRDPSSDLPFRILQTRRSTPITAPVVANVHGTKWMQELKEMCDAAESKVASGQRELVRPETPIAVAKNGLVKPETPEPEKPPLHEGDLYLCKDSLDAFQGAIGGVLDGVDTVFADSLAGSSSKRAFVCVRPPGHHCSADHPSGFCWINNVHIGIEHAAQVHGLTHAAIIDFDLHHGDGSQAIAWARNEKARHAHRNAAQTKKTTIGYFSLHDINSYPCEYGDMEKVQAASLCIENAHNQSIWNVHLQEWKTEDDFWKLYDDRYSVLIEKTRNFLATHAERIRSSPGSVVPKSAIFISAGFDASEHEGVGMQRHKVNVPTGFYARFTADIVKMSLEHGLAADGRVISVLEGGYSDRALMSGVLSHLVGLTHGARKDYDAMDQTWWSPKMLLELEVALGKAPAASLPASRAIRPGDTGNYASPTQAFTNKAVDPVKLHKSVSGVRRAPSPPPKPPTPPPPDIEWALAASELTRLLIPTDRPVSSHKHEDLNEPKPPKKERHSTSAVTEQRTPAGRVTRGSKAKAGNDGKLQVDADLAEPNRRRTISSLPAPPEDAALGFNDAPPLPRFEHDDRPSTSSGSPPKHFFASSDNTSRRSSISSRRSSLTGQSTTSTLQPPKQRQASGPAPSSSRRSSLSRQSTNRQPSATRSGDRLVPAARKGASRPSSSASHSPAPTSGDVNDIDQLAARVKKITLHMSSNDAGGDQSRAAKKPATPRAPTKSKTASTANGAKPDKPTRGSGPPSAPPSAPQSAVEPSGTSTLELAAAHAEARASQDTPMTGADAGPTTSESPVYDRSTAVSSPFEYSVNPEFIPYQPTQSAETAPHGTIPPPGQLTWMEPNQAQTPAKSSSKKGDLPVFTAHSRIPFARPNNVLGASASDENSRPSGANGTAPES